MALILYSRYIFRIGESTPLLIKFDTEKVTGKKKNTLEKKTKKKQNRN